MEGPTPISALIHAATMVTAGVFMLARMSPLFNLSPSAMTVVAVVGGATALFAATIAITQTDIKRIVAYSTVSQLGYMVMACGLGAYTAGMFHLLTHGAFKALLFLGCGSVIHALSQEQDLRRMGGLRTSLPITYLTFLAGVLALSGLPPFSGFFSKDEILLAAFASPGLLGKGLGFVGLVTAALTAFYAFRLLYTVFHGPSRVEKAVAAHVHESPLVMTIPLILLALLSVSAGWVGIPGSVNRIGPFLDPLFSTGAARAAVEGSAMLHWMVPGLSVAAALLGWWCAYVFYVKRPELPDYWAGRLAPLYRGSFRKWYVDEFYDGLVVRPTVRVAGFLWRWFDVRIIDGLVNEVAARLNRWAKQTQQFQSGQLQHYALVMTMGLFVLVTLYLLW